MVFNLGFKFLNKLFKVFKERLLRTVTKSKKKPRFLMAKRLGLKF